MLEIKKFVVNPLQENSFVVSDDTGDCILVDPGFYFEEEREEVKEYISTKGLKPVMIANTHGHFDHIMGVDLIRKAYHIPFKLHPGDVYWIERAAEQAAMFGFEMDPVEAPDVLINERDTLDFGRSSLSILHVPGHSPGHVVFYSEPDGILIVGDVLFYGSIGRTDLPGGDHQTLISGIREKLFRLPGDTKVFCGHGPETTLAFEKSSNPFLT